MYEIPKFWAGSQESLDYLEIAIEATHSFIEARTSSKDPFEPPPTFAVQEGVGIVSVKGPLISGTAGWMRMFGVTGYSDVQDGVMGALNDKSAKAILLDIASGGGAVEGADETSLFIREASRLKPVIALSTGNMASAAYWIGSAANRRLASRTSIVGSIGVTMTHYDRSEQLKKEGVKATVFRSGKWKALGNPNEALTEAAQEQIQSIIDDLNQIFEDRVAANLGITSKQVRDRMGQGREFLGARAVDVGLVDGIATSQEAFAVAKVLAR